MAIPFYLNNPSLVIPPAVFGQGWTWGQNNAGQLITGNLADRSSPVAIVLPPLTTLISGWLQTTYALDALGQTWAVGTGTNGQLGDNSLTDKTSPVLVAGNFNFSSVVAGYNIAFGIDATTNLAYGWGLNSTGVLGVNTGTPQYSSPTAVVGNHSFTKIAACVEGFYTAMGLKTDNTVWCWGDNNFGQPGNGTTGINYSSPVKVLTAAGVSFKDIAAGGTAMHALDFDTGEAWSWGYGPQGEIGNGSGASQNSPVKASGGISFIKIATAARGVFALKDDGTVWAWGTEYTGAFGISPGANFHLSPQLINLGVPFFFTDIAVSGSNSTEQTVFGLTAGGEIWAWGQATYGALGNNTTSPDLSSPVKVNLNASYSFANLFRIMRGGAGLTI